MSPIKALLQSPALNPDCMRPVPHDTESTEEMREGGCGHICGTHR